MRTKKTHMKLLFMAHNNLSNICRLSIKQTVKQTPQKKQEINTNNMFSPLNDSDDFINTPPLPPRGRGQGRGGGRGNRGRGNNNVMRKGGNGKKR